MRAYLHLVFLSFLFTINSYAQDIQFSQFYSNVLYINPAFAGSAHATRVILHDRLQWPGLDAKYITSSATVDHYFSRANSGVGLMVLKDWEGSNIISSTQIAGQYAYELHLSSKYSFRAGFQAGITSQFVNYSALTFPDQFNVNGYVGPTNEPFQGQKKTFFDLSSGGIFYSDNYWLSVAYDHMNQPNQAFYGTDVSRLPYKMDVATGYKIYLRGEPTTNIKNDDRPYITPTAHYKFQGKSQQLDLGVYGYYQQMILGFWYRGIPLINDYSPNLQNNESVVIQVGWKFDASLSMSYSYDYTVSKLAIAHTGGSHELNLTYIVAKQPKRVKIMKRIPCPSFYR